MAYKQRAMVVEYPREIRTKTSMYASWNGMKHRCDDEQHPSYAHYGGRGITYHKDWKHFGNFYRDMNEGYELGLTLDRIDNDGDYTPDNCRWATRQVQARNRRSNRLLTLKGITRTIAEWAEVTETKYTTITQRLDAYGWTVEQALTGKRG